MPENAGVRVGVRRHSGSGRQKRQLDKRKMVDV